LLTQWLSIAEVEEYTVGPTEIEVGGEISAELDRSHLAHVRGREHLDDAPRDDIGSCAGEDSGGMLEDDDGDAFHERNGRNVHNDLETTTTRTDDPVPGANASAGMVLMDQPRVEYTVSHNAPWS
jgi:hypothetical protein